MHLNEMRLGLGHSIGDWDGETHPGAHPAVKGPLGSNIESLRGNGSVALVCGIPVPLGSDGTEPLSASFGRGREVFRLDCH